MWPTFSDQHTRSWSHVCDYIGLEIFTVTFYCRYCLVWSHVHEENLQRKTQILYIKVVPKNILTLIYGVFLWPWLEQQNMKLSLRCPVYIILWDTPSVHILLDHSTLFWFPWIHSFSCIYLSNTILILFLAIHVVPLQEMFWCWKKKIVMSWSNHLAMISRKLRGRVSYCINPFHFKAEINGVYYIY